MDTALLILSVIATLSQAVWLVLRTDRGSRFRKRVAFRWQSLWRYSVMRWGVLVSGVLVLGLLGVAAARMVAALRP